jgi:hypothetical protein
MPFVEGVSGNPSGKAKGTENKANSKARELFTQIMERQVDSIEDSLAKVKAKSDEKYLQLLSKFFPYFVPKKIDVTTDNQALNRVMIVPENLANELLKDTPSDLDNSSPENK